MQSGGDLGPPPCLLPQTEAVSGISTPGDRFLFHSLSCSQQPAPTGPCFSPAREHSTAAHCLPTTSLTLQADTRDPSQASFAFPLHFLKPPLSHYPQTSCFSHIRFSNLPPKASQSLHLQATCTGSSLCLVFHFFPYVLENSHKAFQIHSQWCLLGDLGPESASSFCVCPHLLHTPVDRQTYSSTHGDTGYHS